MARWTSLWVATKDALLLAVNNWRLWLLQFAGNVMLFLALIWWLRPHEANWWQLLYSSVVILLAAAAALVLHGGTLNYFENVHQDRASRIPPSLRNAFKHLPALIVWALIFFTLQWLIGKLDESDVSLPGYLRSEFPAWLRRMISEPALDSIYRSLVWLLRWIILPGLLLPLALACSGNGFRGLVAFRDWARTVRSLGYWITLLLAAALGVGCVGSIMGWRLDPKTATLGAEETSLAFRLLFAYLLGIFSWLLAGSIVGRKMAGSGGQSGAQPL